MASKKVPPKDVKSKAREIEDWAKKEIRGADRKRPSARRSRKK